MLFTDFKGNQLMAVHSHSKRGDITIRIPHFFLVSLKGDKLTVIKEYKP
jgi:hypothetical protein